MKKIHIGDEMLDKLLIVGVVILIITLNYFVANFIFKKLIKNKVSKRKETISLLVVNVFKYIGLMIGIFIILGIYGVDTASVLAGAGLLGILLGLGLQKLLQDMINGFFIIFENQYVAGEFVGINGVVGEVLELGLKTTKIVTYNGEMHFFANGEIKSIANYSRKRSLAIINLPVMHEYSFDYVNIILKNVLESFEHPSILGHPTISGVNDINDLSYKIRITCETRPFEYFDVERKIKTLIKNEFNKKGIKYLTENINKSNLI